MLGPILCGHLAVASLLPKLRDHFAEFLDNASSVGLRILSSSTCVGLRYGLMQSYSGFSRQPSLCASLLLGSLPVAPSPPAGDLPPALLLRLNRSFHSRLAFSGCVPAVLSASGTGISTRFPSATPLGLALGPDLPRADQPCPGNLGYSAARILTLLSLLIPAFSLPVPPLPLPVQLRRFRECSSTTCIAANPQLRCRVLAPDIFGAGPLDQ